MMNNPMMQIMGMLRGGVHPNMIIQQMARQNPQVAQMMRITQGKSDREMQVFVRNMAKERGVDLEDLARSLGITIPSDR